MELNDYQKTILLEHLGYGAGTDAPEKVEILFIGNESGTAGRTVQDYIDRLTYPDKYKTEFYSGDKNDVSPQRRSPMLQYMNRLRLYSQDHNPMWLRPKSEMSSNLYDRVINESWCTGETVHLLDIRPLPRPTEDKWPYVGIDQKLYLRAFNRFESEGVKPYSDWVRIRKTNLQKKIKEFTRLKCIIAAGNPNMKMNFIKGLFPQMRFDTITGSSGKEFSVGVHENQFKIIICKFLNHQNGIGYAGLQDLAEIAF